MKAIRLLLVTLLVIVGASNVLAQEAYAVFTTSNSTLTFYYDSQRDSRSGTTYDLNTDDNKPGWFTDNTMASITSVVFDPSFAAARPTTTSYWFSYMTNLTTITGIEYLNTSEVTNMRSMFNRCSSLTSIDLRSFNTENVTEMLYMFHKCDHITSLDLSNFNTGKVSNMMAMFLDCTSLTTIYVGSGWSTEKLISSADMFAGCTSLEGGNGTIYNENQVDATYARIDGINDLAGYLTAGPYALLSGDGTTLTFYHDGDYSAHNGTFYLLNTGNTTPAWASKKANVTNVVVDPSFAAARPTSMVNWFSNMQKLELITGMENLNTSEVTNMGMMFASCSKLTTLDLSSFDTKKVTNMSYMFNNCGNLSKIYVGSGWNTESVSSSSDMFAFCGSLSGGNGTTFNLDNPTDKTYARIDDPDNGKPGYLTDSSIREAYAVYTTDNATLTFYYDYLRSSRTGTTYDLSEEGAYWINDGVYSSVTVVVFDESFADARPTSTCMWFSMMNQLSTISGIQNLNTSEVTNMDYMFNNCPNLTTLDVSGFNTSKVTTMKCLFANNAFTSLDLSSWNTKKVTDMYGMFGYSPHLTTIYVGSGWSTEKVTSSDLMFKNCSRLVGGNGTEYSDYHIDAEYARIDDPDNGKPGYFTYKPAEAYAVYTADNATLTFYFDYQRGSRTGKIYEIDDRDSEPEWYENKAATVVFDPSFADYRPTSTYCWFEEMKELRTINGIENLNTSEVTDMSYMFSTCVKLYDLDLSHFDTRNVTCMRGMFNYCINLSPIDLSSFNTAKVTDMSYMFADCHHTATIYVGSGWTTENVTADERMFDYNLDLVGGKGTVYDDANPQDKTYAHVDGGSSNPGYFTYKASTVIPGDANDDGQVSIADVTAVVAHVLGQTVPFFNATAADVNQSGTVTIADAKALAEILIGNMNMGVFESEMKDLQNMMKAIENGFEQVKAQLELNDGDHTQTELWQEASEIEGYMAYVRQQMENVSTEYEMEECEVRVHQLRDRIIVFGLDVEDFFREHP